MRNEYGFLAFLCVFFSVTGFANDGSGETVAIIDNGFYNGQSGRYRRSACFSIPESVSTQTTTFTSGTVHKNYIYRNNQASLCGTRSSSTSSSSGNAGLTLPIEKRWREETIPRLTISKSGLQIRDYVYLDSHGANVVDQVQKNASRADLFPVSVGYIENDSKCNQTRLTSTQTFPSLTLIKTVLKHEFNDSDCLKLSTDELKDALRHIISNVNNMSVLNVSLGINDPTLCSQKRWESNFKFLKDRGVAVIAAVGNNSSQDAYWPACLPSVIGVADTNSSGTGSISSIRDGKQDFFAFGSMVDTITGKQTIGSSFSAPLVAGAFATLKSINSSATVNDMSAALRKTGRRVGNIPNGRLINLTSAENEIRKLGTSSSGVSPKITPNSTNTNKYGWGYGSGIHKEGMKYLFQLNSLSADAEFVLSFDGFDIDKTNELSLMIGDKLISYISSGRNNGLTNYSFTINRNDLRSGDNTIELISNEVGDTWGVTNFNVEMTVPPVIDLRLRGTDSGVYGRDHGSDEHTIKLKAEIDILDGHDHVLSWRGYNIRQSDQLTVYVNDNFLGESLTSASNSYSAINRLLIPHSWLQSGVNTIEFRVKSGYSGTWGVRDLLVTNSPVISLPIRDLHGYGVGTNQHRSRVYFSFVGRKSKAKLKVKGWDIDSSNEVAVYLNNTLMGFLPVGGANALTQEITFDIPKELILDGQNLIRVESTLTPGSAGFSTEKWGAGQAKISFASGALPSIIELLLE